MLGSRYEIVGTTPKSVRGKEDFFFKTIEIGATVR
jgi:hypothetical protein